MSNKIELEVLEGIKVELKRFEKKLDKAIIDKTEDKYSVKAFAAVKRSAMDLKNELTNITNFSRYQDEYYKRERAEKLAAGESK